MHRKKTIIMFEPCKYYSPVTDVTFRKVFGENIDLATSLLEVINYNEAEQYLYDKYWDAVSIEATWKGIGRLYIPANTIRISQNS